MAMLSAWASQHPDHSLGLHAGHVEGVRLGQCPVARAFHRQHAGLGAAAVGDEEPVVAQKLWGSIYSTWRGWWSLPG